MAGGRTPWGVKRRFIDAAMQEVGLLGVGREEEEDRIRWRMMSSRGEPKTGRTKAGDAF